MNSFLKILLGFVIGVFSTLGVLLVIGSMQNTEENQLREELRIKALRKLGESLNDSDGEELANIQYFELDTKKGIVELHTYMPKDSVKILMGRPQSTDIYNNEYNGEVRGTWGYRGSNKIFDEFRIEFINGKLNSVDQHKE